MRVGFIGFSSLGLRGLGVHASRFGEKQKEGGGRGGRAGTGGGGGGGASTAPAPDDLSAVRSWSPTGGYPFQAKKGADFL